MQLPVERRVTDTEWFLFFLLGGLWGSWIKRGGWVVMVVLSLLIIASRKHYTVDVVIAWYISHMAFATLVLLTKSHHAAMKSTWKYILFGYHCEYVAFQR
jgi:hypothetical protein